MFNLDAVTAEAIRDEDKYGGVRIRLVARLASAREPFHVDVNIGDPDLARTGRDLDAPARPDRNR